MSSEPQFPGSAPQPKTSRLAIVSLVLGVFSFLCCLSGVPAIITGAIGLGRINRSGGTVQGKGLATAGIVTGSIGTLLTLFILPALLLPAIQAAREAARRNNAANELKQIGIAIHGLAGASGRIPAPASYDAEGKPLLSWRVHILPYLEQQALYARFNLNEPWDSPHNKPLLAEMPAVYGPGQLEDPTATRFLMPTGPGSLFPGKDGPRPQIPDGPDNTIMVVEVDDELGVPWTAPRDYQYNNVQPRAGLSKLHPRGFLAATADAAVHHIEDSIPDSTLLLLFDPADNSGMTLEKANEQPTGK